MTQWFDLQSATDDEKPKTLSDVATPIFDQAMGYRLSIARMNKFWRREELAPMLGINETTLGRLERGTLQTPQKGVFSVSKLEEVFNAQTMKYIVLGQFEAYYNEARITDKFWKKVRSERKPQPKGQHWSKQRLQKGLPMQGATYNGIPGEVWDEAWRIHRGAKKKNTK